MRSDIGSGRVVSIVKRAMRYLTADEIKTAHRDEAHEILGECVGKSIRDRFAIEVFNRYHDRFFSDRSRTRILDLGIASGAFLVEIAKDGYRDFTACDIDNYAKPEAQVLLREFRVLDFSWEKLPWPDASFDIVTAWCVLPHLENPFFAAREVGRVLRPGGLFIFTTPFLTSKPSMDYFVEHGDFTSYRVTNNHIVLFPRGVVQKTIISFFELVGTEYHARLWKIFRGPRGFLRRILYRIAGLFPGGEGTLQKRWAYNIVYILRRPQT